jgi:hypothetical protein
MTCRDCIHYFVCSSSGGEIYANEQMLRDDCLSFMRADNTVEVVRCKDCKHHPDNGGECDRSITHTSRDYVCEVNTYRYIGLDYCSYGERSENGKS